MPAEVLNERYEDEDDFDEGLAELYNCYSVYTSAAGPTASQAALQTCLNLMNRLAWTLEAAESDYASVPGRLPYVNQRGEYLIGSLLVALAETHHAPEEVLIGMLLSSDINAQIAASRFLVSAAPFYSDKSPPAIFQILREETAFERLMTWVESSEESTSSAAVAAERTLLIFATGLLAVLLMERDVADYIVRTPIPAALLKRLMAAPMVLGGSIPDPPEHAPNMSGVELERRSVLYCLSCLTSMGEYQEILTPFFQKGGLELVLSNLHRPDVGCRLAAIELTSRLLAHKKFSMAFVQAEGVDTLLELSEGPQAFQLHAALAMCLFGLASLSNVMEEVCRLPGVTFERLMRYAISLLRCPQEAAQKSIVLFFGVALAFRPVLQAFDSEMEDSGSNGGVYSLLNLLRTGGLLGSSNSSSMSMAGAPQRRGQLAHYTTLCLRHYLRVHLAIYANMAELDAPPPAPGKRPRLNSQDLTASSAVPSSFFRPVEVDDNAAEALLTRVRSGTLVLPLEWAPVQNLLHERGLLVLLGLVASSSMGRAGAAETAKFALDCLEIASLLGSSLEETCLVHVLDERTGLQILLEAASGLAQRDAEVMKGALRVLCNCICPRMSPAQSAAAAASPVGAAARLLASPLTIREGGNETAEEEKIKKIIRTDLRAKDGIKVLVSLLRYRRCIQAADEIRMLATHALLGLTQDAAIAQILEKMHLSLVLSEVVRAGPVLERSGSTEHYATLRAAAMQLIARITGRPASAVSHSDAMDPASWKLEKAAIVTRTNITYDPADLLHLIRDHLHSQGLYQSARTLEVEAGLLASPSIDLSVTTPQFPPSSHSAEEVKGVEIPTSEVGAALKSAIASPQGRKLRRISSTGSEKGGTGAIPGVDKSSAKTGDDDTREKREADKADSTDVCRAPMKTPVQQPQALDTSTPRASKSPFPDASLTSPSNISQQQQQQHHHQRLSSLQPVVRRASSSGKNVATTTPMALSSTAGSSVHRSSRLFPAGLSLRRPRSSPAPLLLTPSLLDLPSPFPVARPPALLAGTMPSTSLDQIVVQYLRRQHEQCPNPICVLPAFSLTLPHRCPEPPVAGASLNISRRMLQRQALPPHGGWKGREYTRSLIFGRFRPWRSYRDEGGRALTCTAFPRGPPGKLWAGTDDGTIRLYNLWTSEVDASWDCHPFRVSGLAFSPPCINRPVLLTCASEVELDEIQAETCLWAPNDMNSPLLRFENLRASVFDVGGTRIAGLLLDNTAQIYDAEIGTSLKSLRGTQDSQINNPCTTPNICFSPVDGEVVLCDGVLWDLREPSVVHRFDRLSSNGGSFGAFHPNGNDVLIDGTVWDLRSHSLRTMMTGVEQCVFKFSVCGDVIYAYRPGGLDEAELRPKRGRQSTCIQVVDASDYQTIHIQETERHIWDLALDDVDLYLSVVEGSPASMGPFITEDAIVRLYEVGRRRPDEADSDLDDAHSSEEDDDDEDWAGEEDEDDSDLELELRGGAEDDDEDEDEELRLLADEEDDDEEDEEEEEDATLESLLFGSSDDDEDDEDFSDDEDEEGSSDSEDEEDE